MERKIKMITLLKALLVIAIVTEPVICEIVESTEATTDVYSTELYGKSILEEGKEELLEFTTTYGLDTSEKRKTKNNEKYRGSVKYGVSDTKWADLPQKPFLYGKRFELRNGAKESTEQKNGELNSPLITTPIRALASVGNHNAFESDVDLIKHQNDILNSVRDSLYEKNEGVFNKTYFAEEAQELENHGGEAAEETWTEEVTEDSKESNGSSAKSNYKSRQDGDRSLMVVLPFKASDQNIEELFTKSPMVKIVESEEDSDRETTPVELFQDNTNLPNLEEANKKEIIPTTKTTTFATQSIYTTKKRWRPYKRHRTTTEILPIAEKEEDAKIYINYKDAEMVTKKYENPTLSTNNFMTDNHQTETPTPYPIERLRNTIRTQEQVKSETTIKNLQVIQLEEEHTVKPKLRRKGQRRKPTTGGPPKPEDLTKVMEVLPPDMKDLLLELGLNKQDQEEQIPKDNPQVEKVPQPTIDPKSYAIFKPLPLEVKDEHRNFVSDDMKDFLASFGLLPTGKRVQKSLQVTKQEKQHMKDLSEVDLDFLPEDFKSILDNLGLVKTTSKTSPTRIHIFNPSNHTVAGSVEDLEKLNAILTSIKSTVSESQDLTPDMQNQIIQKIKELKELRYKNGNLSDINSEIDKIIISSNFSAANKPKSTTKRATKLLDGPDPVVFTDETISKNEVKRQNSTSTSGSNGASASASAREGSTNIKSESSSSSSNDTTISSSASPDMDDSGTPTEETPNIEALKESFGGGETAPDDVDVESSLPPRRPNGLYFLFDWNSFLEVGTDDDSRRVNIRFQPKIGESRNFLSVSVP